VRDDILFTAFLFSIPGWIDLAWRLIEVVS
jgi:hypothetical protein